jgi:rubredoxin
VSDTRNWPCPDCGDLREFVQPPCADGHTDGGGDCPEWVCPDCGSAVLAGPAPVAVAATVRRAA